MCHACTQAHALLTTPCSPGSAHFLAVPACAAPAGPEPVRVGQPAGHAAQVAEVHVPAAGACPACACAARPCAHCCAPAQWPGLVHSSEPHGVVSSLSFEPHGSEWPGFLCTPLIRTALTFLTAAHAGAVPDARPRPAAQVAVPLPGQAVPGCPRGWWWCVGGGHTRSAGRLRWVVLRCWMCATGVWAGCARPRAPLAPPTLDCPLPFVVCPPYLQFAVCPPCVCPPHRSRSWPSARARLTCWCSC